MVRRQLVNRGISDPYVLKAMHEVERHRFVPEEWQSRAYDDSALPIGQKQTISQPYIVAYMLEKLQLRPSDRVLEIGTGSAYQAALLGEIAEEVYTIEIVDSLAEEARQLLDSMGYDNVQVVVGDGYSGYPEKAPYDAITVTAAGREIPPPLIEQLADGGRLLMPVGEAGRMQYLELITKKGETIERERLVAVRFVPFTRKD